MSTDETRGCYGCSEAVGRCREEAQNVVHETPSPPRGPVLCLRFARVWQCGRWFPTTRERRRDCPLLLYASYLVLEEQEKSRIAVIHCGQSAE